MREGASSSTGSVSYHFALLERPAVLFFAGSGGGCTIRGGVTISGGLFYFGTSIYELSLSRGCLPFAFAVCQKKFWQNFAKIGQKFSEFDEIRSFLTEVSVSTYNSAISILKPSYKGPTAGILLGNCPNLSAYARLRLKGGGGTRSPFYSG